MTIEIRKAGFINKGAELMLYAIIEKIKERYPDAKLVMAPTDINGSQPFHKLVEVGFYPKAWFWKFGIQWGNFLAIVPTILRRMYGVVLDKEIDIVIDAAGFSYSDQWGIGSSKELANSSKRWKKNKVKTILLPQAFGPFQNKTNIRSTKKWAKNIDLIFPREEDSYTYLTNLVGKQEKIKLFPDFTNLVSGSLPSSYNKENKRIAIIPNYRMIDKTSKEESEAYLPFMIYCAQHLKDKNCKPFILVHEGANDLMLANKISDAVGGIPIIKETNPLYIKGIIGSCEATIGSRFHGLVSALSQGIPSLSTGWSHKYYRLFEDYDFIDGAVSILSSKEEIDKKLELITNEKNRQDIQKKLKINSEILKEKSQEMWNIVFDLIEGK